MEEVFISHTGIDNETTQMAQTLYEILSSHYKVFCSSVAQAGIKKGEYLHSQINQHIKQCQYFIVIATENYLKSSYCLYELSIARYLEKKVIIIYSTDEVKSQLKDIADAEWVSVDLKNGENLSKEAKHFSLDLSIPEKEDAIIGFFQRILAVEKAYTPYIGMSQTEYNNLLSYCHKQGVCKFGNGQVYTKAEMIKHFEKAKTVYIVSTTGAGLIKTLKEEAIPKALRNQATIHIILPDKGSEFCEDVAMAECSGVDYNDVIIHQNNERLKSEFEATFQYLNEAYCKTLQDKNDTLPLGEIHCYNSRTLLRQTILLVISETGTSWGWINLIMAPLRTTDTPSIAISDNKKKGLDSLIIQHCECMMAIARQKGEVRTIQGSTLAHSFESKDTISCEDYWKQKNNEAKAFMRQRKRCFSKVLIEVASQHPLYDLQYPNAEFSKRLDMAIDFYQKLGADCVEIYVPGSRHKYMGVADEISLSEAGKNYLIAHGVNPEHVFGDEINQKYKGDQGVYNSADECFVASNLFKDGNYGQLICICSSFQVMRKVFLYLEFGIFPECYGVSTADMFHDPVSEFFGSLSHTVFEDHNWQDEHAETFINSRKDRRV